MTKTKPSTARRVSAIQNRLVRGSITTKEVFTSNCVGAEKHWEDTFFITAKSARYGWSLAVNHSSADTEGNSNDAYTSWASSSMGRCSSGPDRTCGQCSFLRSAAQRTGPPRMLREMPSRIRRALCQSSRVRSRAQGASRKACRP